jgi:hypothetical protein
MSCALAHLERKCYSVGNRVAKRRVGSKERVRASRGERRKIVKDKDCIGEQGIELLTPIRNAG